MNNTRERLQACFRTVFPKLPEAGIFAASTATVEGWDSLAAINLFQVIEEEFHVQIDLEKLAELDSFEALLTYLSSKSTSSN